MTNYLLHIISQAEWAAAQKTAVYSPSSLATEGFIHCSTVKQVLLPANEMFHGQTDLLLLCINNSQIDAPIVYEDCYQTGHQFPHIYGPLPLASVFAVVPFPCQQDGTFTLPPLPNDAS